VGYNRKGQPLTVTAAGGGNSLTNRYTYDTADPVIAGATCG
jgi:YD repeat-containing protein